MTSRLASLALAAALALPGIANAALVGHWTFEPGAELADLTGNFNDLTLFKQATISDGGLNVTGDTSRSHGYATARGYTGPAILDKTLVSTFRLDALYNVARAGSVLTLDRTDIDVFDGIVFASQRLNAISPGSESFRRSGNGMFGNSSWVPEGLTGEMVTFAITYDDLDDVAGGDVRVSGYRNSVFLGSYVTGNSASFSAGNAEVVFGPRSTRMNGANDGGVIASIFEARIYDTALTELEVANIGKEALPVVPLAATLPFLLASLGALGLVRRGNR